VKLLLRGLVLLSSLSLTLSGVAGEWLKGDLHCHSTHSDGKENIPGLLSLAQRRQLDFLAVTDHDSTMKGKTLTWNDPHYRSEKLILLYGMEWGLNLGHANVIAPRPIDYAPLWKANLAHDPRAAAQSAQQQGAIFSINHPLTGAGRVEWQLGSLEFTPYLEIWNFAYAFPTRNRFIIENIWDPRLLNNRVVGIGGSDRHEKNGAQGHVISLGNPTTWVYASKRNPEALMQGLREGRVSVSYAPWGPRLELYADADLNPTDYELMIGDNGRPQKPTVRFRVLVVAQKNGVPPRPEAEKVWEEIKSQDWPRDDDDQVDYGVLLKLWPPETRLLSVIRNGKIFKIFAVKNISKLFFKDTPDPKTYYRLELYGPMDLPWGSGYFYGDLMALTNPLYFGY
jgi:hypothetical protein